MKIDLAGRETVEAAVQLFKSKRKKVLPISAKEGKGLDDLVKTIGT